MSETATSTRNTGAADGADVPSPEAEERGDQSDGRRSRLPAPLRWLAHGLSGLVRWVARRLRRPLRRVARLLMLHWVARHLPPPLRWLGGLFAPERERGFGFWWLVATLAVAVALGLVVALLLTPVAGLIALLIVAIWALVRRRRGQRDDRHDGARSRGQEQRLAGAAAGDDPLPYGAGNARSA